MFYKPFGGDSQDNQMQITNAQAQCELIGVKLQMASLKFANKMAEEDIKAINSINSFIGSEVSFLQILGSMQEKNNFIISFLT